MKERYFTELLQSISQARKIQKESQKGGDAMPRGDGTGPQGKGAKTGRQMGSCKGAKSMGYGRSGGKGRGAGAGGGRRARGK